MVIGCVISGATEQYIALLYSKITISSVQSCAIDQHTAESFDASSIYLIWMLTVYTVADLCHPLSHQWNASLISDIFDTTMAQRILQVPVVHSQEPNLLRWKPATAPPRHQRGFRNPKPTGYHTHSLPWSKKNHATHCWPSQAHLVTQNHTSTHKDIQALATGSRAGRFTKHINQNCQLCGKMDFTRAFLV
jgi:hypothetical protein